MSHDMAIQGLASMQERLAREAERNLAARTRRLLGIGRDRELLHAYRRLFCEPDSRALKADAQLVLADLSSFAKLGGTADPRAPDSVLREHNGRRAVALHFLKMLDLDGAELAKLASKMREAENNG